MRKKPDASVEITPEEIKKAAKDENMMLLQDSKFGREDYVSVQCSWPQLIRFARRISKLREPK